MSEVLALDAVGKTYHDGARAAITVLDKASLTLPAGEVVALVAPSGAGKSTLLHIAGLLDHPTEGTVRIMGSDVAEIREGERTRLRRDRIGFIYQFHHLLPEFTALENVMLPRRAAGVGRTAAVAGAMRLLDGVGLAARASHRPAELSGGEQQRVAFARALANGPSLLLADEPTGNLDPETSDQVFSVLMKLVRETGLAALIATHNLDLARKMDRILRLRDGRLFPA